MQVWGTLNMYENVDAFRCRAEIESKKKLLKIAHMLQSELLEAFEY